MRSSRRFGTEPDEAPLPGRFDLTTLPCYTLAAWGVVPFAPEIQLFEGLVT
jgi:hypothetical protein